VHLAGALIKQLGRAQQKGDPEALEEIPSLIIFWRSATSFGPNRCHRQIRRRRRLKVQSAWGAGRARDTVLFDDVSGRF
jgi:hypothetical protein